MAELNLDLSFLSKVKVEAVMPKQAATRTAVVRTPENADLRVYPNGSIYPSKKFVADHELEYQAKGSELPGYGIDVFRSEDWSMVDLQGKSLLFAAIAPKDAPKVDLFSKCTYNEDGTPKSSVLTQGKNAFVAQLIEMIAEVYKVDFSGVEYVELNLVTEHQMTSSNGIYALPTKVARGANKGQLDFKKRKDVEIFPLVVSHIENSSKPVEQVKEPEQGTLMNSLDKVPEDVALDSNPAINGEEVIADFDDGLKADSEDVVMPETPFNLG